MIEAATQSLLADAWPALTPAHARGWLDQPGLTTLLCIVVVVGGLLLAKTRRLVKQARADAEELRRTTEALRSANAELDRRVEERTAALSRSRGAALSIAADADDARRRAQDAADRLGESDEQIRRANRELEAINRDLEQFAYAITHDLKEPLRMIGAYLELLERRYRDELDRDAQEFIGFAVDGAQRMHRLIDDLLAFSRAGADHEIQPVDCAELLEEALANLALAIEESGAVVTHDPLPTLHADRSLLQVFQNLIGNALKFRADRDPVVHVGAARAGDAWVFSVTDNGVGLQPDDLERIFNLFERLHARDEYPGTGIGLAVCKRIVERHGGSISVESQVGRGSTFRLTLPINHPEAGGDPAAVAAPGAPMGS